MKRSTLYVIIRFCIRTLTRTEFIDAQYVPPFGGPEGAVILATNHLSRLDIPVLMLVPKRPDVIALVADKYKQSAFFTFIVNTSGCIWLDRDKADFGAMRAAAEYLRKGGALGIAPEGTRSQTGVLLEGKPGTILLASKVQVPIVPIGIAGTENGVNAWRHLQRPKFQVRFGPQFNLSPMDRDDRDGWLKRNTDEIMCRIGALLPPSYRGFYANHPRLLELTGQNRTIVQP
jgi:1-acyl-sn-glycerol-3-phosphate acyltransferase